MDIINDTLTSEDESDDFSTDEEEELGGSADDDELDAAGNSNQFDDLCDGVVACMSFVNESVRELYEFQNELMRHKVPPSLLLYLTIVVGKMYRSVSDLHQPINELIRLVRLYSISWDEKSKALRRLHDSYERKCRQLSIAINRLKLVDAQTKQLQKTQLALNWEKLFLKLTTGQGQAVQWKFSIEPLRQTVEKGAEHLETFIKELDKSADVGLVGESSQDFEATSPRLKLRSPPPPPRPASSESEEVDAATEDSNSDTSVSPSQLQTPVPKVETADAEVQALADHSEEMSCWTHEMIYEWRLHMRVYTPRLNMQYQKIKCLVKFAQQTRKSDYLDDQEHRVESASSAGKKRNRLLKHTNSDLSREKMKNSKPKFEDFVFRAPFKSAFGWDVSKEKIKLSLLEGTREDIVGLGTIDVSELDTMETAVVELPAPRSGYEFEEDLEAKIQRLRKEQLASECDYFAMTRPLLYPLYSVMTRDTVDVIVAKIPLSFYWSITPVPRYFERANMTAPLYQLVEELTGVDMDAQVDRQRMMQDSAVSPIPALEEIQRRMSQPAPKAHDSPDVPPTVAPEELSALIAKHADELHTMQNQYEDKIAELTKALSIAQAQTEKTRNNSRGKKFNQNARTPPKDLRQQLGSKTPKKSQALPGKKKPKFEQLPNWGEFLPEDFLGRVEMFMSESLRHRNELNARLTGRIQTDIERRLADQYKLSRPEGHIAWEDDITLPALFMPVRSGNLYNPRAHEYFHPSGIASDMRITQPPSIIQLPPIPSNRMAVVNLFELSNPGISLRDGLFSRLRAPPPSQKTAEHGLLDEELIGGEVETNRSMDEDQLEEDDVVAPEPENKASRQSVVRIPDARAVDDEND